MGITVYDSFFLFKAHLVCTCPKKYAPLIEKYNGTGVHLTVYYTN